MTLAHHETRSATRMFQYIKLGAFSMDDMKKNVKELMIDVDSAQASLLPRQSIESEYSEVHDIASPDSEVELKLRDDVPIWRLFAVLGGILLLIGILAIWSVPRPLSSHSMYSLNATLLEQTTTRNYTWTLRDEYKSSLGRSVITINHAFPGPTIELLQGDTLTVSIHNELSIPVAIHWHGLISSGDIRQDGVPGITQLAIQSGTEFTYFFRVLDLPGTYWWHGHDGASRIDGLFGGFIVHPRTSKSMSDSLVLCGDWYDESSVALSEKYLSSENNNLVEPTPTSMLVKGVRYDHHAEYTISPSTRYHRLRFINTGAHASIIVYAPIKAGSMTVISADGRAIKHAEVESLTIEVGQRYDVEVDLDDYTEDAIMMIQMKSHNHVSSTPLINHFHAAEHTNSSFVNNLIELELSTETVNGMIRSTINSTSYVPSNVPLLEYESRTNDSTHAFSPDILSVFVPQGREALILIRNRDGHGHPIHVHGHTLEILAESTWSCPLTYAAIPSLQKRSSGQAPLLVRDTVQVHGHGWVLLKTSPIRKGIWLLHCHNAWHHISGMSMILTTL